MLLHYSSSYCFQLKTRSQLRDARPSETAKNWSWIRIKNKSNHVLVEITEANVACFLRQLSTHPKTYLRSTRMILDDHMFLGLLILWNQHISTAPYHRTQKILVLCHAAGFSRLNGSFSASISRPSWVSKNTSPEAEVDRAHQMSQMSLKSCKPSGWNENRKPMETRSLNT